MAKPSWKDKATAINREYTSRMQQRGEFQNTDQQIYYMALALCGEAGELANLIKKRWRGQEVSDASIEEEIADVRVYLNHIADLFGIDVDEAIINKLKVVESRLVS